MTDGSNPASENKFPTGHRSSDKLANRSTRSDGSSVSISITKLAPEKRMTLSLPFLPSVRSVVVVASMEIAPWLNRMASATLTIYTVWQAASDAVKQARGEAPVSSPPRGTGSSVIMVCPPASISQRTLLLHTECALRVLERAPGSFCLMAIFMFSHVLIVGFAPALHSFYHKVTKPSHGTARMQSDACTLTDKALRPV